MSSAELSQLPASIRERAMFSAKTTNADYLQKINDLVTRIVSPEQIDGRPTKAGEYMDPATARLEMKQALQAIGYQPDAEQRGGLQDLSSDVRLDLIVKTNTEMAQGFGNWFADQDPARLDANWLLWNAGGEGMARNDRLKQALEFGADPDSPNPGGWSGDAKLLFDVVDDPEARGLLLSHGAKADAIDEYGNSAWSHVRTAEAIEWAAGAIPLLIEAGGRHGTPAQEMAADGRLDLVLLMKEKGASMDPGGEEKSSVPVLLTASCFNSWRGELTEPDRLDDIAKAGMIEFAPGKDAHGQPGLFETAMKHAISEAQDFTTTAKNGCSWTTTSKPDFSLAMKLAGMSKGADPLSDFGSVQDAAESRLRKNTYEWTGKDFDPAARKIKSGILKEAIEGRIERGEPHLAAAIVLDSVEFARKAMDKGERPDQAMMDFSKDRGSGYWRGPKAKLTPSALDAMAAAADRKDLKKDLRVKAAKAGDDIGSALDNQKSKDRKNGPGQGPAQSSRRRI
jgi:hypothetical protein